VQDFVPKKHLARFILGLVRESLDLKEIKKQLSEHARPASQLSSHRALALVRFGFRHDAICQSDVGMAARTF
jgi:hypothetical protein